ncbi:GH25 family lysozyme [Priestia sp. JV24]|uniref:GH25 family lysozyme n=1 Tax=Priestia TaxID=2800373 RepID=UPI0021D689B0|nr:MULTISPECIES: GH25 family lysozyme [Priestia]MCU7712489.1 GH25 family lysozyme [Priestia megaterium]MCW1046318.1 GH25 family lysozyme [Priestia sp. JV24]
MQSKNSNDIFVIDVSNHQGDVNWKQVAENGVKGVYLKLTEGTTFLDKRSYKNYLGAKNAGLRVGFYCFSHVTNDPKEEVEFFLKKLADMKPDMPHCLDLENDKGQSKSRITSFALGWLEYMEKKTGITPILYTMMGFLPNLTSQKLARYPLWIARYNGKNNPGSSSIWSKWAMYQYTDKGSVKGIKGNVDLNAMAADFFKAIDTGVSYVGDANPPSQMQKGDSGLNVKELQQNLIKLKFEFPKHGADGSYGDETISVVKAFQKANGLTSDGIAGEKTLAKIAELIKILSKPKEEDLPKVVSLGDKNSLQVKAIKDIGVYKYANLAEKFRTIKKDTVFSVYGYTYAAWAVPGGFVQMKDAEPIPVTLTTGGLNKDMETDFRAFLKSEKIAADLNLNKTGNPSATITVAGLELVKVRQFLDKKDWYYK